MSPKKDDFVKRRWGDESPSGSGSASGSLSGNAPAKEPEGSAKIDALLRTAEPLIEQVNTLYRQFIGGAESLPPNERRKQLEKIMESLQQIPKPTATSKFRVASLNTRYLTYKDRWDRLMKDLEAGRIKRTVGPKR
jgi:hypothetical protein